MHLTFGDIVVVEGNQIGVIVKSWIHNNEYMQHEVYVRNYNKILTYKEKDIKRYLVRHKYLSDEELEYQLNAENPFVSKLEVKEAEELIKNIFRRSYKGEKNDKLL